MQQYRFRQLDVPSVEELVDSSDVFNELTLRVLPCAGERFSSPVNVRSSPVQGSVFFSPVRVFSFPVQGSFLLPCACEILPCAGVCFLLPCECEILPCTGESFFLPCACEIREFRLFPEMKFSPVQFTSAQLPSCRPLPEKWATVV